MLALLTRWSKDESGATAIEYSLICALIFLVIVTAVRLLMGNMGLMYARITTAIMGAG